MSVLSATARRFHFGLNVADLDRAVDFYRVLFGVEPMKRTEDHVKFEVGDPPLVLALHPGAKSTGGALNHVGFRVANSEALVEVQRRLEMASIRTQREEGVECCYARQTKFWISDADRNLWEVYTLEEDLDHSGFDGDGAGMPPRPSVTEPARWRHILTAPLPATLPHGDVTLDEVELEGTFNAELSSHQRTAFVAELFRVLKPGGKVSVHGLVSNVPFPGKPSLPGPAAMVQRIPVESETHDELQAAGFVNLSFERLGDIHCFRIGGVEFRELRLSAHKAAPSAECDRYVLYRGPLRQVVDERGTVYRRGERVRVDQATWELFQTEPWRDDFTCLRCAT
jgi:catechol 2,3-dioxygenase-like lactoylglutathione lyase family enzyme